MTRFRSKPTGSFYSCVSQQHADAAEAVDRLDLEILNLQSQPDKTLSENDADDKTMLSKQRERDEIKRCFDFSL